MYSKKMILLFCTGEACWHETQLSRESTFTLMVDFNFALNIQTQIYKLSTETLINREYRTYQSERQRSKAFFKIINAIFNISKTRKKKRNESTDVIQVKLILAKISYEETQT